MRKILLAVALSGGFTGAACAEASLTLYGSVDAGLGYNQVKGRDGFKESRVGAVDGVSGASRFGLLGSEDLGDGLRATFNLEGGFSSSNGKPSHHSRLFGRQATVGLQSGDWGRLEFGRQTNLASKHFLSIDPFGESYKTASMGTAFGSAKAMRLDNLVLYQTPSFGGLRSGIGYSFNADDNRGGGFRTSDNNRVITAGAQYLDGPLTLAASYDRMNPSRGNPFDGGSPVPIQQYIVGGAYDLEVLKLSAVFGQTRNGWFSGADLDSPPPGQGEPLGSFKQADGFRANSYLLGLTLPLGANTIMASWQHVDPGNSRLTGDDRTFSVYSLGYTYDLSKRTNLYAYASYADNFAFQDDLRSTAAAVGLRHRF